LISRTVVLLIELIAAAVFRDHAFNIVLVW